jgi:hypothetical protein
MFFAVKEVHAGPREFRAVKEGRLGYLIVPASAGIVSDDVLAIYEIDLMSQTRTGQTVLARAMYITANGSSPCALSPEGVSNKVAIVSLELISYAE